MSAEVITFPKAVNPSAKTPVEAPRNRLDGFSLEQRILAKVRLEDRGYHTPCWIWTGCKFAKGYAAMGAGGKTRRAHRVSYEVFVGPIPEGLQLDHLCGVRECVNPSHLEPVTGKENTRRGRLPAVMAEYHAKRKSQIGVEPLSADAGASPNLAPATLRACLIASIEGCRECGRSPEEIPSCPDRWCHWRQSA